MRGPPARLRSLSLLAALLCAPVPARAGGTHYWTWHKSPSPESLEACAGPMRKLAEARKGLIWQEVLVASPAGAGVRAAGALPPLLAFNGLGDDAEEPFRWPGHPGFNSCKTSGRAYDEVVTAVLIAARDCFAPGLLAIGSDIEWDEWSRGARLYESVTGRKALSPLGGEVHQAEEAEAPAKDAALAAAPQERRVRRAVLDWLPAGLLAAFVILFLLDRLRPRRIEWQLVHSPQETDG